MDGLDRRESPSAAARLIVNASSAASAARIASARPGCSNGACSADDSISCSGSCRRWRSEAKTIAASRRSRTRSVTRVRASRPGTARGTSPAAACPTTSSAASTGCTSITSRGGRPHTSSVRWWMAWRTARGRRRRPSYLGDDDDALLALVALHPEGDDVAGAHAVDGADGALDVLGEHVAAADDDDVLDPPAQRRARRRPCRRGRRCAASRRRTARRWRPGACSSRASPTCRGSAARRRGARAAPRATRGSTTRISRPGHRRAEQRQAAGDRARGRRGRRPRSAWRRGRARARRGRRCRTPGPRPRGGNEPPMATSAIPNAGNTPPGRNPNGSAAATNASTASGSTGSAPDRASVSDDRSRSLHPLERPGGQHPREVGPGRRRAAVVGDPLHPVAGVGEEVLRRGLHERGARRHRDREEPDQAHVVVQRQPRHHDVVAATSPAASAAGVDVRRQHPVGDHHALRLAGRAARVLQDDEPLGVGRRHLQAVAARHAGRAGQHGAHRRRSAGRRAPPS